MRKARAAGTQMTIRHVPPAIDRALRRKARASGKSINDVALDALAAGSRQGEAGRPRAARGGHPALVRVR